MDCQECEYARMEAPLGICPNVPYALRCMNPAHGERVGAAIRMLKPGWEDLPVRPPAWCEKMKGEKQA